MSYIRDFMVGEYYDMTMAADGLYTSPDQQQSWQLLCKINGSLSSTRKDFKYLCYLKSQDNGEMIENANI